MKSRGIGTVLVGISLVLVLVGEARATLVVDDDKAQCPEATYTTIAAALAAADEGDDVQVCPGIYPEQLVLTKKVRLIGKVMANTRPLIRPTALIESRPSLLGGRELVAGIIVDTRTVIIDSIDLDLSANDVSGCEQVLVGILFRNTGGIVSDSRIGGARVSDAPACDTGIGIYVESGAEAGEVGKAKVTLADNLYIDFQKSGVVANGPESLVKLRAGEVIGSGLVGGAVQNGVQLGVGARGKVSDLTIRNLATTNAGKTATGLLLFHAARVNARRNSISDVQTGVFVAGQGRVVGGEITNVTDDGIVLLGDSSLVSGNTISSAGVSGMFVIGDRNRIRFGTISDAPIGIWLYGGEQNNVQGIKYEDVDQHLVGAFGGPRDLSEENCAPLLPSCRDVSDCDDSISCTIDACNNGFCSHIPTCADSNPCTDDICEAGGCVHTPNSAQCDDGNACTVNDTCVSGTCRPGSPIVCGDNNVCTFDACSPVVGCVNLPGCDDHNPCTADTCTVATGCRNLPIANGASCNDPNPCNGSETCQAGICQPSPTLLDCSDNNPCTVDSCDPLLGCRHLAVPGGTACSDGDVCNGAETCHSGTCGTGTALDCDDNDACTSDSCNGLSGCIHAPIAGCISCTTPADCDDSNPCTSDLCNASACSNPPAPDGTACSDGDACNGAETCLTGSCSPGTAPNCDDNNVCTSDSCEAGTGCVHSPLLDGTACPNGTLCDGAEACLAGICVAGTVLGCDDGNPCTTDNCLALSGCEHTPVANGTSCTDNNACNGAETCQAGTCTAGAPPDCDDNNACSTDSCNPASGCAHGFLANGTQCGNNSVCDGLETCQGGSCATAPPLNCDDNNACTVDDCNALSGCTHTPISGCRPCSNNNDCNDGDPCTTDMCNSNVCQNANRANGASCSDGDQCNGAETCQAGACTAGTALDCDDNNICTTDACDPSTGCQHASLPNGTSCADSTVCNGAETCQGGICTPGTPLNCNDGVACTLDTCQAVSGCQHTTRPNGTSCADSTVCNGSEVCQLGLCVPGIPLDCNDNNPCTTDACLPLAGCQHLPISPCP